MTGDDLDFVYDEGQPTDNSLGQFGLEEMIGRYAFIQEDLARMGADQLVAEANALRDAIKSRMMSERRESATDEVTLWGADLSVRTKDVWDPVAFQLAYPQQYRRYVDEVINSALAKAGIKSGVLSRAKLEEAKAVRKELLSVALRIAPRKREEDDEEN